MGNSIGSDPSSAPGKTINLHGKNLKIIRQLGEGISNLYSALLYVVFKDLITSQVGLLMFLKFSMSQRARVMH